MSDKNKATKKDWLITNLFVIQDATYWYIYFSLRIISQSEIGRVAVRFTIEAFNFDNNKKHFSLQRNALTLKC